MSCTWFKKGSGQVSGSCASGSKFLGSIKRRKFLDQLTNHQVLKKDFGSNYKKGEAEREYRIHIGHQNFHQIKPIRTHLLIFRDAWPRRHLLAYPLNEKERVHIWQYAHRVELFFFFKLRVLPCGQKTLSKSELVIPAFECQRQQAFGLYTAQLLV